nr:MAG TPA: hypothetical protein [Caudoviricetes sp.]
MSRFIMFLEAVMASIVAYYICKGLDMLFSILCGN